MIIPILMLLIMASGCEGNNTADKIERERTAQMAAQAADVVGFPNITNFAEKQRLKRLYELRDNPNLTTYTYTFADATGQLQFLCESVGFGIPFAAQFSNPERVAYGDSQGRITLPQPEPNGIFTPTSSSATFVTCLFNGREEAVYVEPSIIVSPFPLHKAE